MHHPHLHLGRYFWAGIFLIMAIVLADQYTKWLVMESALRIEGDMLPFTEWFFHLDRISYFIVDREKFNTIAVAPFFNLVMVWNQGISFGLFDSNSPYVAMGLIGISLIISLMLVIWLALTHSALRSVAIGLVVGGAVGNVIDRVRFGAVADFLDFYWGQWHWPAFNLADSAIVVGAFLLALTLLRPSLHPDVVDV